MCNVYGAKKKKILHSVGSCANTQKVFCNFLPVTIIFVAAAAAVVMLLLLLMMMMMIVVVVVAMVASFFVTTINVDHSFK